jgi:uncharacterized membrane protein YfbV (UPF0208 family)
MDTEKVQEMAKQKLDELETEYKRLRERAKLTKTDLQIDYTMKFHELRQKMDELGIELRRYRETGKGSWQVLAEGFEKAAKEMGDAFRDAWTKLKQ